MDAEDAARRFVRAALARRREVILTPLARVSARLHGLMPSTTIGLLRLVNRVLPGPTGSKGTVPGHAAGETPRLVQAVTRLDQRAARRFHQYDDTAPMTEPDPVTVREPAHAHQGPD